MIGWGDAMGSGARLFLWSALIFSLLLPTQLHAQGQQLGKIIGNVRIVRGDFPPHPVLISLEMRGSPIASAYSDGQGRFGFYNLVANQYRVTVSDDSYEPFTATVDVE